VSTPKISQSGTYADEEEQHGATAARKYATLLCEFCTMTLIHGHSTDIAARNLHIAVQGAT
jgi:hypothetical protein